MELPKALDEGTLLQYWRLFLSVLLLFVFQAALQNSAGARLAQTLAGSAALMLAVRLAPVRRQIQVAVFCVVGVAIIVAIADVIFTFDNDAGGMALLVNGLIVALGPPLVFLAVRQHSRVSLRTVLGAVTIYVLVGLFFAFVYRAMLEFDAEAFQTGIGSLNPASMQYFSFVTLTTVGFGDITAVSDFARTLVALEALMGQVYLVTVVALVVGNLGRGFTHRNSPESE